MANMLGSHQIYGGAETIVALECHHGPRHHFVHLGWQTEQTRGWLRLVVMLIHDLFSRRLSSITGFRTRDNTRL
jgi:hypothetical protein